MHRYTPEARWFIARCYQLGMSYEEFLNLAKRVLCVDVPRGTYAMQKYYLKLRTPEQMASEPVIALSQLTTG